MIVYRFAIWKCTQRRSRSVKIKKISNVQSHLFTSLKCMCVNVCVFLSAYTFLTKQNKNNENKKRVAVASILSQMEWIARIKWPKRTSLFKLQNRTYKTPCWSNFLHNLEVYYSFFFCVSNGQDAVILFGKMQANAILLQKSMPPQQLMKVSFVSFNLQHKLCID